MKTIYAAESARFSTSGAIAELLAAIPLHGHTDIESVRDLSGSVVSSNAVRAHVSAQTPPGHVYRIRKQPNGALRIYRTK
jgi:hypothetical protein